MLSQKQIKDVCLVHQGHETCRYLSLNQGTYNYVCIKQVPKMKSVVDHEVSSFKLNCKSQGQDPNSFGRALGSNCSGYPLFLYALQGYDVKPKP